MYLISLVPLVPAPGSPPPPPPPPLPLERSSCTASRFIPVCRHFIYLEKFIEMTSNMIYFVALGVGLKCPRNFHLNFERKVPPAPRLRRDSPGLYLSQISYRQY